MIGQAVGGDGAGRGGGGRQEAFLLRARSKKKMKTLPQSAAGAGDYSSEGKKQGERYICMLDPN